MPPVRPMRHLPLLAALLLALPAVAAEPAAPEAAQAKTTQELLDAYAFANTLSAEESRRVWERYAIPAPGAWAWEYGVFANFKPGPQETWVDYSADRAPLLFIGGSEDFAAALASCKREAINSFGDDESDDIPP